MVNDQLGQAEDEIGAEMERLEIGWITRFGKPNLFKVAVTGRSYNDPHPILKDLYEILEKGNDGERVIHTSVLRKKYPPFGQALRLLGVVISTSKIRELKWSDVHCLCFELE